MAAKAGGLFRCPLPLELCAPRGGCTPVSNEGGNKKIIITSDYFGSQLFSFGCVCCSQCLSFHFWLSGQLILNDKLLDTNFCLIRQLILNYPTQDTHFCLKRSVILTDPVWDVFSSGRSPGMIQSWFVRFIVILNDPITNHEHWPLSHWAGHTERSNLFCHGHWPLSHWVAWCFIPSQPVRLYQDDISLGGAYWIIQSVIMNTDLCLIRWVILNDPTTNHEHWPLSHRAGHTEQSSRLAGCPTP